MYPSNLAMVTTATLFLLSSISPMSLPLTPLPASTLCSFATWSICHCCQCTWMGHWCSPVLLNHDTDLLLVCCTTVLKFKHYCIAVSVLHCFIDPLSLHHQCSGPPPWCYSYLAFAYRPVHSRWAAFFSKFSLISPPSLAGPSAKVGLSDLKLSQNWLVAPAGARNEWYWIPLHVFSLYPVLSFDT